MIKIHDNEHLLSPADVALLESEGWPFEAHVLIQTLPTTDALDDAAHQAVTGPHVVVIAVDPVHRHTAVRFGTESAVKAADYDSIAKAGNAHFRAKEWAAGIQAIGVRAQASAESRVAMAVSNEPVVIEKGLGTGAWIGIALLFGAVVACVVLVLRRMRAQQRQFESTASDLVLEASEYRGKNLDASDARDFDSRLRAYQRPPVLNPAVRTAPFPQQPSYPYTPPVIVNNGSSGSGDLALGMLIGEELANNRREVIYEERSSDYGGSTSSYDDSSPSSPDDSGGSTSSFDFGSGGDSGGGGDGGGGGDAGW